MAALMTTYEPVTTCAGFQRTAWRPRTVLPFRSSRPRSTAPRVVAMAGASLEKIADKLGDEMYADLNGWRLYLRDMKADGGKTIAQVLAEAVASGDSLDAALKGTNIKLGGGKKTVGRPACVMTVVARSTPASVALLHNVSRQPCVFCTDMYNVPVLANAVPLADVVPDNQIRNATRTLEDLND